MKNKKKLITGIIICLCFTIIMYILYTIFKNLNNELYNQVMNFTTTDTLLGKNNDILSKANLYNKLALTSKYLCFGSLGIFVILLIYKVFIIKDR